MMEHGELWRKLEAFDLDGEAQLSFSRRLARDNGWTPEFARRVVGEYKRFVFLAATAGHPVTPSDEVDQAWHLHLVYTHSYWDEFCGEVLGFPLHHGPTKGGKAEGAKFGDWYEKTLESYQRAFGEEAPRDIWPEAEVRFGEAPHFRRVNTRRVWVVRKPEWTRAFSGLKVRRATLWSRLAPVALLLLIAGCATPTTLNVSQWDGKEFLSVFWTLCALVVVGILLWRKRGQAPFDAVPVAPLNGYELARLKDGGTLAVDVALAALLHQGAIELQPSGMMRSTGAPIALRPLERAVLQQIREDDDSPVPPRANLGTSAVGLQVETIDQKLQSEGLLLSPEVRQNANKGPLVAVGVLVAMAVVRVIVGIERQRPVGFLVLSIAALVGYAIYLWNSAPRRSRRGDVVMRQTENSSGYVGEQVRSFQVSSGRRPVAPEVDMATAALFFAVVGASAFPAPLYRVLYPQVSSSDRGYTDGGSDGGGGDGGSGCGGCGGCGGGGD